MATIGSKKADDLLALALARGLSVQKAADQSGLSTRTAHRRLSDPAFQRRVDVIRSKMLTEAVGRLAESSTAAVDTLKELLKSESDTVRLGAARSILEFGLKMKEACDHEARIAEMEAKLAGNPGAAA